MREHSQSDPAPESVPGYAGRRTGCHAVTPMHVCPCKGRGEARLGPRRRSSVGKGAALACVPCHQVEYRVPEQRSCLRAMVRASPRRAAPARWAWVCRQLQARTRLTQARTRLTQARTASANLDVGVLNPVVGMRVALAY